MGRNGASLLGLVIATALLAAGCTSSSSESAPPPAKLPDGFHAVEGARLGGTAIPQLGVPDEQSQAWYAVLEVESDARSVYRALARQAKSHDLAPLEPAREACSPIPSSPPGQGNFRARPGDMTCNGFSGSLADGDPAHLDVTVRVCRACSPPVSAARLTYVEAGGPSRLTLTITRSAGPRESQYMNELASERNGVRVLEKADFDECQGSSVTVLKVTGDVDRVWRHYVAGLVETPTFEEWRFNGHGVTQVTDSPSGYSETLTLIEGGDLDRPILVVENCGA